MPRLQAMLNEIVEHRGPKMLAATREESPEVFSIIDSRSALFSVINFIFSHGCAPVSALGQRLVRRDADRPSPFRAFSDKLDKSMTFRASRASDGNGSLPYKPRVPRWML